ncbi:hypothetical protein MUP95_02555, partial [bacterium]|nr:hypothetical protein [bacterium]
YGVEHFTRKGIEKWNQSKPPFQKKTKAGNVNAWLDTYGYQYEFFVQLDIDQGRIIEIVTEQTSNSAVESTAFSTNTTSVSNSTTTLLSK